MTVAETDAPPPRRSKLPLILGVVLGLAGAAGGFMATRLGLIALPGTDGGEEAQHAAQPATDAVNQATTTYVPLDPLIVNVGTAANRRFLRFVAQIETQAGQAAALEALKPRFADVLNGYLRAVDLTDLENPRALDLLRGQMLRRLQTVAGDGAIRDLLIVEFVLN